jgi:hypothetical protein
MWVNVPNIQEVERRILEAQKKCHGHVDTGVLLDALGYLCRGDSPSENHARLLAQALGSLLADDLLIILHQVAADLKRKCGSAVYSVEQAVRARPQAVIENAPESSQYGTRVAQMRRENVGRGSGLVYFAILLQALEWALDPPPEPLLTICRA